MKYKLIFCLLLVSFFLYPHVSHAAGLSAEEKSILALQQIDLEVEAVEIEMGLWLTKDNEASPLYEKGSARKPAEKALKDLARIKAALAALQLPKDFKEIKSQRLRLLDDLSAMYLSVSKQKAGDLGPRFEKYWRSLDKYEADRNLKAGAYLRLPKRTVPYDMLAIETASLTSPEDQASFRSIKGYLKEKRFNEAADKLKPLLEKYRGTTAEGNLLAHYVDCLVMSGRPDGEERSLKLLSQYLAKRQYAPTLTRLYLQWRTFTQMRKYGLSNWSQIPNEKYLTQFRAVVQVIEAQIDAHPEDEWAKVELFLLMNIPQITRWPDNYPIGNSAGIDYYRLFRGGFPETQDMKANSAKAAVGK